EIDLLCVFDGSRNERRRASEVHLISHDLPWRDDAAGLVFDLLATRYGQRTTGRNGLREDQTIHSAGVACQPRQALDVHHFLDARIDVPAGDEEALGDFVDRVDERVVGANPLGAEFGRTAWEFEDERIVHAGTQIVEVRAKFAKLADQAA